MIKIYYTYFTSELPKSIWNELIALLPARQQEKVLSYKRWQDRYATLYGKLLLRKAMMVYGYPQAILDELLYNKYNKPYFQLPIDFNISHSDNLVACAVTEYGNVGLDIEKKISIELNDFSYFFKKKIWNNIQNASDKLEYFYHYWSLIESVVKADGRGLSMNLRDLVIMEDGTIKLNSAKWFTREIFIDPTYKCFLAFNINTDVIIEQVIFQ